MSEDFAEYADEIIRSLIQKPDSLIDLLRVLKPEDKSRYSRDDRGLSVLFAECFRSVLRYNVTAKEWFRFDGKIWRQDTGGMTAAKLAKDFAEALITYGFQCIPDGAEQKEFLKTVGRYGDYGKRRTLVDDARSEMNVSAEAFDRDGKYYCCQNGVFNLDTYELIPHGPDLMLSKISNVVYDPSAEAPRFEQFLREIMENDSQKIDYLLKAFGYALTDDTREEQMIILYGASTRNGKSTLLETISHMHGGPSGYSLTMMPETLAQRKVRDSRQASGDIARLDGCRFLVASEPPKRMLFDAALLKTLLGRDTITARNLHEREFEFVPKFKLFMNSNYLPVIQDDTLFTSGRIKVVEFNRHFSPDEQDSTLKQQLMSPDNISGIFNWCVAGLQLYRTDGFIPPKSVVMAVEAYRASNDKIQNFLNDCMELTGRNTAAGAAYERYRAWCLENGYGVDSKRSFFEEIKAKNLFMNMGTVNGITVKNVLVGYEFQAD